MAGIACLSPLRGKKKISEDGFGEAGPHSKGGFVMRDLRDIRNSEAVLLYFPEPPGRQSIGSWFEMGYAHALGLPIIVVTGMAEVLKHPFIQRFATEVFLTMPEAIANLCFLLGDHEPFEVEGDSH